MMVNGEFLEGIIMAVINENRAGAYGKIQTLSKGSKVAGNCND